MFLKHNLAAILWALLILVLCGMPGDQLPDTRFFPGFDKVAHVILYLVLALLLIHGFRKQSAFQFLAKYPVFMAMFISIVYGIVVEILQGTVFVSRSVELFDIVANSAGSLLGSALFVLKSGKTKN